MHTNTHTWETDRRRVLEDEKFPPYEIEISSYTYESI